VATLSTNPSAVHPSRAAAPAAGVARGHTSHSRLHRFAQCPLSFKLHYLERLLATLLKVLGIRKESLDAVLAARLAEQDELAAAGVDRDEALARVAAVDGRGLSELLDGLRERVPRDRLTLLKAKQETAGGGDP